MCRSAVCGAWLDNARLPRVVAVGLARAARIFRDAARLWHIVVVLRRVPIGCSFPHIANHVVEAMAVWRKCFDRRGAPEAVLRKVLPGKLPLPCVGHVTAAGCELVSRGEVPLGFRWRRLAAPFGIGPGISICNKHDRMIVEPIPDALMTGLCQNPLPSFVAGAAPGG
jgi:hypothetical protein